MGYSTLPASGRSGAQLLIVGQGGPFPGPGHDSERLEPHPDVGAALNALATLARQKRRRGYRDRMP